MWYEGIDWSPVLQALVASLAAFIIVVKGPLAEYLKARAEDFLAERSSFTQEVFRRVGHEAVLLADRLGKDNSEKKDLAVRYAMKMLESHGLSVDESVVDALIEAILSEARVAGELS